MFGFNKRFLSSLVTFLLVQLFLSTTYAANVNDSLDVVGKTNASAATSQAKIDQLSREATELLEEYRQLRDGGDYEAAYTRELDELHRAQLTQIEKLQRDIARARITRQRIVPLMRAMAEALETFVILDTPFHHEERVSGVLQLKQRLNQPELSTSSRFRLLLEAYQLEQGYGSSVEAWRGPLQQSGDTLSVEYLRVGRVALYYRTLDGSSSGYWSAAQGQWVSLGKDYNRDIGQALRVAKNQGAPQLLQLPLPVLGGFAVEPARELVKEPAGDES